MGDSKAPLVTPEVLAGLSESERAEAYRLLTGPVLPPEEGYQRDPVGWARDVLGIPEWSVRWSVLPEYRGHVWDGTVDPIAAMLEAVARGDRKVAVESATGTGKTYGAAILALWFIACHRNALVVTAAPKEDQLTALLWKEMGRHWPKFSARYPMATTVKLRVRMSDAVGEEEGWAAIGWVCGTSRDEESASKARGFHAEHMLIITEETTGIQPAVMKSFAATCTASHNIRLALGNPDHQQDTLHQFATQEGTTFIRASAFDHPNVVTGTEVIPGACSRASLLDWEYEFGKDTAMYASKARGICPAQSVDALIRREWVEQAFRNAEDPRFAEGQGAFGVDVAQSPTGRDKACLVYGTGAAVKEIWSGPCDNADEYGEKVVMLATERGVQPKHVGVDAIGVGSNVVNAGKRLGFAVTALQSAGRDERVRDDWQDVEPGQKPVTDAAECLNLRARMYWQLRQDLMHGRIALPKDEGLLLDLVVVEWQRKNGKIVVKSKDLIRDEIGRSTDKGDAVAYWNWVRPRTGLKPAPTPTPFTGRTFKDLKRRTKQDYGRLGIAEAM